MTIVNCWLIYRRDAETMKLAKTEVLALAQFKLRIAEALVKEGKTLDSKKRGRPSLDDSKIEPPSRKGRSHNALPEKSVRLDNVGHLPVVEDVRRMCKNPGCNGKTNVKCIKCDVNLCLNNRNNCFLDFHTK